jgi:hypothetical protein
MGHYDSLAQIIKSCYRKKGSRIEIEPHGSRGPDILGCSENGQTIVGEIKGATEILRDLNGYWGQWNSDRSFGGKTNTYKLRSNYADRGKGLPSSAVKGWVSVIDGQLRGYCRKENCPRGDLVVESYDRFEADIRAAIDYLKAQRRISKFSVQTDRLNIGYITFEFV